MYAGSVVAEFTARDVMVLGSFECRRYSRDEFLSAIPLVYASVGKWVGRMQRIGVLATDGRNSVQRTFVGYSYVEFRQPALIEACRAIKAVTPAGELPPLEGANPLGMLAALPYGYAPPAWQTSGTNRHEFGLWMKRLGLRGVVDLGAPRYPENHRVNACWERLTLSFRQTLAASPINVVGTAVFQRGIETVWVSVEPWLLLPPHTCRIELPGLQAYVYYRGVRTLNVLDLHLLAARAQLGLTWDALAPESVPVNVASFFTQFSLGFLLSPLVANWFSSYGLGAARARAIDFYLAAKSFPGAEAGPLFPGSKLDVDLSSPNARLARGQPPMRTPSRRRS
jgi:hypothetical protein